MKKLFVLLLITGFVFFLGGCNTPNDGTGPSTGPGEEIPTVTITDGGVYNEFTGDDYPGFEVDLKKFLKEGESFEDISRYSQVIVDATLYSAYTDEETNTIATLPEGDNKNLAQFTLLTDTGGWPKKDDKGNACGPTKYSMAVNGKTTWTVTSDSTGIPAVLLVQKNEVDFKGYIAAIKVNSVEFVPKGEGNILTDGGLYVMANSDNYPGAEVALSKFLQEGETLKDISEYASVTVDATLYSDENGETLAVKENNGDNLAQFKLLIKSGEDYGSEKAWDAEDNICSETKYNMAIDGKSTLEVKAGNTGVPAVLLLQANWAEFPNAVKSIKVNTITFNAKPPAGTVILSEVYGGDYMDVEDNAVSFKKAMYSDCAALYKFPDDWTEDALKDKTITFTYRIPEHECDPAGSPPADATIEHQIHIQAAQKDPAADKFFNGKNDQPGQKYITLSGSSGSFTVSANELIDAAGISGNADDGNGPFTLDSVRIVNNGTAWNEPPMHYRCKTYTLVFESITK